MSMSIPPLALWQAFAIGLPLAIAGFVIQEMLLRRRAARGNRPLVASTTVPAVPAADTVPTVDAVATPDEVPMSAPGGADRPSSPWLPGLLELESDLDEAIEAIVDFVEAPPRLAGALGCAEELDRLVPGDHRGAAFAAFVNAVRTDARPTHLQQLADAVGVDLTAQLLAVRKEINPGG
jgi:hypothetical protein